MTPTRSGRLALPVAITATGLLALTLVLFFTFQPKVPPARNTTTTKSTPRTEPNPNPAPETPALDNPQEPPNSDPSPAEPALTSEITSRDYIATIDTSTQAAETHRALTADLITQLEKLSDSHDLQKIKVAAQELADRFYLLDRAVALRNLEKPGPASVTADHHDHIERILAIWDQNMEVAITVDQLFRERELLTDEHVSQMLRRWMEENP